MTNRVIPPRVINRFRRYQKGESMKSIADAEGISVKTIQNSFAYYGLSAHVNPAEVNDKTIRLYNFIMRFWADNGYWPNHREMGPSLKTRSTSVVQYHLNRLIAWGWITRANGKVRAMKLTRVSERGLDRFQLKEWLDRATAQEAHP